MVVGGLEGAVAGLALLKNQTTVGRVVDSVLVEKEVSVTMKDQNFVTLVLKQPDFTTAARLAERVNRLPEFSGAKAVDAATVLVPLAEYPSGGVVGFVSRLERLEFVPDQVAKVLVNGRTGTIVIGDNVVLTPVAIAHGNISIKIEGPEPGQDGLGGQEPSIKISESESQLLELPAANTLAGLVKALNMVGTTPRDLISILQALRAAGALSAELEVI